jgi:hypothetical protein
MNEKKTELGHTPTPWKYDNIPGKDRYGFPCHLHRIGTDAENAYVLDMEDRHATDNADAAFIVRAVNNHDALVEALDRLLKRATETANAYYSFGEKGAGDIIPDLNAEISAAYVALAKANGKKF